MLTAAIGRLFAVAEAYPQLRATENFQQLQAQLADTEQKIAVSRQVYNDTVLTLRQRHPDGADEPDRRHVRLPVAAVLPDRRAGSPRGPAGHLLIRRLLFSGAAVALAALAGAPAAAAKSFSLPQADVAVTVRPNGSLVVVENITFAFDGPFTGAYRDIPLRKGESLNVASVAEGGRHYTDGASTAARERR